MIPKILERLNNHRPKATWIKNESGLAYLPLDVAVPTDTIQDEWQRVRSHMVRHRDSDAILKYKNEGWHSLSLYGVGSKITEARPNQQHSWTDIAEVCPNTCEFFKKTFGEKNFRGRIRFMLLEPGGHILPHTDRTTQGLREVNIAINNPIGCDFYIENKGIVPFTPGSVVMLDLSNRHWVVNDSDEQRLHMIYHGEVPDEIIEKSYENLYYTNQ